MAAGSQPCCDKIQLVVAQQAVPPIITGLLRCAADRAARTGTRHRELVRHATTAQHVIAAVATRHQSEASYTNVKANMGCTALDE
jgi:hypothetical protein